MSGINLLEDRKTLLLWAMAHKEIRAFSNITSDDDFKMTHVIDSPDPDSPDQGRSALEVAARFAVRCDFSDARERVGYLKILLVNALKQPASRHANMEAIQKTIRRIVRDSTPAQQARVQDVVGILNEFFDRFANLSDQRSAAPRIIQNRAQIVFGSLHFDSQRQVISPSPDSGPQEPDS